MSSRFNVSPYILLDEDIYIYIYGLRVCSM